MLKQTGVTGEFDPETDTYLEVDDIFTDVVEIQAGGREVPRDGFSRLQIAKLDSVTKKKANSLNKRLQSTDGEVSSKFIDDDFISGYALWDLALPPYDLDALARIYEESSIHNAAVNAKAINCVGLGYKWEHSRKIKKKLEAAGDDQPKYDRIMDAIFTGMEDLDELFESFHEEETFTETWTKAVVDMFALGNGYIEIGRRNDGSIGYVGHVPATQIRVRKKRDGFIQQVFSHQKPQAVFFRNFQDKETPDPINRDPRPNELIHLKNYSPSNTYYGVPHIVAAMHAVAGDKFAKEYNIDFFENKAIPRYAIVIKGAKLSATAKQELVKYFRNEVKGKNHGTLVIPLPATMGNNVDIKFEKLETGIQDASFERYRNQNRNEVITAHRVPPTKVGVYDNANLATSRDADKTFKEQVIGPEQERIERRINRIVKEFSSDLIFRFVKLDIIDEDMKSRIHDRYLRTEVITPNEVRSEKGLPALKEGNKVLPYPTNIQDKKIESDAEQADLNRKAQKENLKTQAAMKPPAGSAGAPTGNANNPTKAGPSTPKNDIGTRAERGQAQDSSGVRERSGK